MDLIHELKDAAGNYAEIVRRSGAPGATGDALVRQADGTYKDQAVAGGGGGGSSTIIRRSTFSFRLPHAEAGDWARLPVPFATSIVSVELQDEDGRAVTATVEIEAVADAGFPAFADITGGHDVALTADDRVIVDDADADFADWSPDLTAGTTLRARIASTDQTTKDLLVVVTAEDELTAQVAVPRLIVVPTTLRVVGETHRQVVAADATLVMSELQGRTDAMTATIEVWRAPAVAETDPLDFGAAPIGTLELDGSEDDARGVDADASGFTGVALVAGDTLEFRLTAASVAGDIDAWLTARIGDASGVGGIGGTVAVGKIPVMVGAQTAGNSSLDDSGTNLVSSKAIEAPGLILSAGLVRPVRAVSADTTLDANDYLVIVTASATVNLPAAASHAGRAYEIVPTSGAIATVDPNGAELIDGVATLALTSGALIACDGTGWHAVAKAAGGGGGGGGTSYELFGALPLASTFTAVSAANITNTDGAKSMRVRWTASGANQVQLYKKAAPATPYDVCLRMRPALTGSNVQFGLVLRNASSGKFVLFSVNSLGDLGAQEWTSGSAFSSQVVTGFQPHIFSGTSPGWLRIHNDGTTLTFYYSADGDLWVSVGTRALASFLSSCNEYGFGGVCQSAAHVFICSLDAALPT